MPPRGQPGRGGRADVAVRDAPSTERPARLNTITHRGDLDSIVLTPDAVPQPFLVIDACEVHGVGHLGARFLPRQWPHGLQGLHSRAMRFVIERTGAPLLAVGHAGSAPGGLALWATAGGDEASARRTLHQVGGGPNTSTALRPPKANEFDMACTTFFSRPTFGT